MIEPKIRKQIFDEVNKLDFLGKYSTDDNIVNFLNKIWELSSMPSEDSRFKDAEGDAYQHLVNNGDWTIPDTFINRFKLIEGDEKYFIRFIETIVSPDVRKDRDEIVHYVSLINPLLQRINYKLVLSDYFEELPVYKLKEGSNYIELPLDIQENNIPFYKNTNHNKKFPCFVISESNWNDYFTMKNSVTLNFCKDQSSSINIGHPKIIKKEENKSGIIFQMRLPVFRPNIVPWDKMKIIISI